MQSPWLRSRHFPPPSRDEALEIVERGEVVIPIRGMGVDGAVGIHRVGVAARFIGADDVRWGNREVVGRNHRLLGFHLRCRLFRRDAGIGALSRLPGWARVQLPVRTCRTPQPGAMAQALRAHLQPAGRGDVVTPESLSAACSGESSSRKGSSRTGLSRADPLLWNRLVRDRLFQNAPAARPLMPDPLASAPWAPAPETPDRHIPQHRVARCHRELPSGRRGGLRRCPRR